MAHPRFGLPLAMLFSDSLFLLVQVQPASPDLQTSTNLPRCQRFIGRFVRMLRAKRISTERTKPLPAVRFLDLCLVLLVTTFPTFLAAQAPTLTSISPTHGIQGTQVTFTGTGFGTAEGNNGNVQLGNNYATVVSWSDTQVVAIVPSAVSGTAAVAQNGAWSNGIAFTMDPPTLTSVSPTHGAQGSQVTLTGTGFGASEGNYGNVQLGNNYATVVSWSDTQVVAIVPPGVSGTAEVQQNGAWSNGITFTMDPPTLTSISPTHGIQGTQVTFTGTGFGTAEGNNGNVQLGNNYATVVSWSDTQVVAIVPSAVSGTAAVAQNGAWSNGIAFTMDGPIVSSVTPSSAPPGANVTIVGSGFGAAEGNYGNVQLGNNYASVVSWSNTQVVATVPAGNSGTANVAQNGAWSNGVPFTILQDPSISSLSPTSGTVGTTVTISGSNFGSTQGTSIVTFNGVPATPSSWGGSSITVSVPSGSSSGNVTVAVAGVPSNGVSFTVLQNPNIASLSPTSGGAGASVTITGTNFGATQGTGKVWLGSTYATVVSWSDTSVVATVASNSTSGTAQVQQGGAWSNAVTFNVNTASISSVSPTSGVSGTQVTIAGSGFGATQGSGQVWLGTASGIVQSWSDTQLVAVVTSGSTTGNAQILQGGVWSNAIPFTVNSLNITSVTPNSGGPGSSITITGTGFGSNQGSGTIWLGSTNGQVVSWSDTEVDAVVAPDAVTGIARVEQNGVWSNSLSFTVPSSGGSALTIVPNMMNLVVGETHTIQALNSSGQPVTGLTWISSDTSVINLSTDDPPILTAVAPGHITITAGTASADVTVWSSGLPTGTVIWSSPGNGSGVSSIVPAVPSPSGVADVFAFQTDGTVQAVKSDGTTAWTASANQIGPYPWSPYVVPDFQGGLVVAKVTAYPPSITKLDGMTGQPYPAYTPANQSDVLSLLAVHTDGTIFALDSNFDSYDESQPGTASVIGIDPTTGTQKFVVPLDQSTSNSSYSWAITGCGGEPYSENFEVYSAPTVLNAMIAGDGYAYVAYQYQYETSVSNTTGVCINSEDFSHNTVTTTDTVVHLVVLRVGTDGSSSKIDIKDWEPTSVDQLTQQYGVDFGNTVSESHVNTGAVPNLLIGGMITNSDQGTVIGWEADVPQYCGSATGYPLVCGKQLPSASTFGLATTSGSSLTSFSTTNLPGQATAIIPGVQTQDGSFVGAVGVGPAPGTATQYNMIAFDQSGNVRWSVPNDWPYIATADGGVIGYSTTYDANGNATGQLASLPTYSWTWSAYQLGSLDRVAANPLNLATSFWPFAGANASGSSTAVGQPWFPSLDHCTSTPGCIGHFEAIYNALDDLISRLANPTTSALAQTNIFDLLGNDANGHHLTTQSFVQYLTGNRPHLYDGLRSTYCYAALDGGSAWSFCNWPLFNTQFTSVEEYFTSHAGANAVTGTPSYPLLTFFRSDEIGYASLGQNLGNEGTLFHEALHGITGQVDSTILDSLHLNSLTHPSCSIALRIQNAVLRNSPNLDPTDTWSCPNKQGDE